MKQKEFPTIRQMENAILFWMNDNYGKCEYHEDTHTFTAIEYIPYPVRDSGGSIDSIDFEPVEHSIGFQEAYRCYYLEFEKFLNENCRPVPVPVGQPQVYIPKDEDWDLPF